MHFLIAGNPNCGKTTLFNALTREHQRVGNWPGVTVEKKTGQFLFAEQRVELTDIPGIYALGMPTSTLDEQIAEKALLELSFDLIINIVDACHLERHLYLTSQLLELGKPMIVVLNMMDLSEKQGITIDIKSLSQKLHCPVVALQAHTGIGIDKLHEALKIQTPAQPLSLSLKPSVQKEIDRLKVNWIEEGHTASMAHYSAFRCLEKGQSNSVKDIDILLADARYTAIHQIITSIQSKRGDAKEHITAKIDKVVLHRIAALPIFFTMMYLMFLFAINIGGAFQDFFDISTDTIFVQGSAWVLYQCHSPEWLIALLANGVGKGINTTITFVPVIAAMFFFLSFLETSGYMARAAFVVDKIMRLMGLPGKSFVPMIVGFGCNVPAIMAARTLDSERDRILTVLMSPFMSCSARLAIYAVFVAAFFPSGGQNVVFSLYLMGILMAVFTGFLLRNTLLQGQASPLILELPSYHRPTLKRLLRETGLRLRYFIWRAGKMIVPVCIVLGGLNALNLNGTLSTGEANTHSVLSYIGQNLTPIFSPMGLTEENWPATVGLLTGMLAKEVVVGSLNALYAQMGQFAPEAFAHFDFVGGLKEALFSIPHNIALLGQAFYNPIVANAPSNDLSKSVYGMMVQRFDGQAGAYAYLLFILLYIPCVSTMAVIRQETNRRLMWMSILWSFFLAYACAVIYYQIARFAVHPEESIIWIIGLLSGIVLLWLGVYWAGRDKGSKHVTATS